MRLNLTLGLGMRVFGLKDTYDLLGVLMFTSSPLFGASFKHGKLSKYRPAWTALQIGLNLHELPKRNNEFDSLPYVYM